MQLLDKPVPWKCHCQIESCQRKRDTDRGRDRETPDGHRDAIENRDIYREAIEIEAEAGNKNRETPEKARETEAVWEYTRQVENLGYPHWLVESGTLPTTLDL